MKGRVKKLTLLFFYARYKFGYMEAVSKCRQKLSPTNNWPDSV
jgi:hypothetical protein